MNKVKVTIQNSTTNRLFTIITFFLVFSGYYVMLMLVSNFGSTSLTRSFTIPIRIVIVMGLYLLFRSSFQRLGDSRIYISFLVFLLFYLIRILYEIIFGMNNYYMPKSEFLLYFVSFVFLPFIFLSHTSFNDTAYQRIFYTIVMSSIIISFFTYYFYNELIGQVSRITSVIKKDDNYISPLALSYCASLGMGVGGAYLLTNKTNLINEVPIWISILSCFIPFFLGASRGSVFALFIPFLLYFVFTPRLKSKFKFIFAMAISIIVFIIASNYFGTGVFDRFLGTKEAIETGSSSAIRWEIWKADLQQFMKNPIFGNSLASDFAGHYPHNIIIESLITTGVIGIIPLIIFIYYSFKKCIQIIRYRPKYFWLSVIFMQAFIQYMFSGAIWGASWVAIGAALIIGFPHNNK